MEQKIGLGYDIHRFHRGCKLMLGGVEVPHSQGLDGHSDADVLLHAICDAILGALGKGDIGEHFSNKDPQYKNISSLVLLKKVGQMMSQEGFSIGNMDCVILAEEPMINPYKPKMRIAIASSLVIDERRINIKATTQEKLGAIGQKQGIAATAVVLLTKS
jgi:2-C-methyl-D-erythritol 2,4-cyclodiphosphate synthase